MFGQHASEEGYRQTNKATFGTTQHALQLSKASLLPERTDRECEVRSFWLNEPRDYVDRRKQCLCFRPVVHRCFSHNLGGRYLPSTPPAPVHAQEGWTERPRKVQEQMFLRMVWKTNQARKKAKLKSLTQSSLWQTLFWSFYFLSNLWMFYNKPCRQRFRWLAQRGLWMEEY